VTPRCCLPRPAPAAQVFKYGDNTSGGTTKLEIYFSFGGLLMKLVGDPTKLKVIEVDSAVYLLIRRL
jgi:DNA-directed RNA polymerase I, II, and III subunit RPABC3